MKLYAIYDRAASLFVDRILVLPADASARRLFQEALVDPRAEMSKYPRDYELYYVGKFDSESGAIESAHVLVMRGTEVEFPKPEASNGES